MPVNSIDTSNGEGEQPQTPDENSASQALDLLNRIKAGAKPELLTLAQRFVRENFAIEGYELTVEEIAAQDRQIHYWRGDFYCYNQEEIYEKVTNLAKLTNRVLAWLKRIGMPSIGLTLPEAIVKTLKGIVHIPDLWQPPFWLRDGKQLVDAYLHLGGVLNLRTGENQNFTSQLFFISRNENFSFDHNAPSPTVFLQTLESILPSDHEAKRLYAQWTGYVCLTNDTSQQKVLFAIGAPRGGKGLLAQVRDYLAQGPVVNASLQALGSKHDPSAFAHASIVRDSDVRVQPRDNLQIAVSNILKISAGERIWTDPKNRTAMDVAHNIRLEFLSNAPIVINDWGAALVGRGVFVHHRESFLGKEDTQLIEKLKAELPGILLWAVWGLHDLWREGKFVEPVSSQEIRNLMLGVSTPLAAFLSDCCIVEDGATTEKDVLYQVFERWHTAQGDEGRKPTKNRFSMELMAASGHKVGPSRPRGEDGHRTQAYANVRLNPNANFEYAREVAMNGIPKPRF